MNTKLPIGTRLATLFELILKQSIIYSKNKFFNLEIKNDYNEILNIRVIDRWSLIFNKVKSRHVKNPFNNSVNLIYHKISHFESDTWHVRTKSHSLLALLCILVSSVAGFCNILLFKKIHVGAAPMGKNYQILGIWITLNYPYTYAFSLKICKWKAKPSLLLFFYFIKHISYDLVLQRMSWNYLTERVERQDN